jgi:uncharacterized protein (TIGR00369 family)
MDGVSFPAELPIHVNAPPERFADAPISQLVGFQVEPGPPGEATVKIETSERHHNPMGRVHGGMLAALADAAMGIAFGRTLLDSEDFSTIEMKINFIRPVREGLLTAKAKVTQRGLRVGFLECEVRNPAGKLVATSTGTCMVITQ